MRPVTLSVKSFFWLGLMVYALVMVAIPGVAWLLIESSGWILAVYAVTTPTALLMFWWIMEQVRDKNWNDTLTFWESDGR